MLKNKSAKNVTRITYHAKDKPVNKTVVQNETLHTNNNNNEIQYVTNINIYRENDRNDIINYKTNNKTNDENHPSKKNDINNGLIISAKLISILIGLLTFGFVCSVFMY